MCTGVRPPACLPITNSDTDRNAYGYANSYCYAHSDTYGYANSYCYAYSNTYSDDNSYTNANSDGYSMSIRHSLSGL
jgi:hypothetical protein